METYRVDFVEPIHVRLSDKGIDPSDQVDTGDEGWHACVVVFKMRSYCIPAEFTDVVKLRSYDNTRRLNPPR